MFHVLFLCPQTMWSFRLHQSITPPDHDNLRTWLKDFNTNLGLIGPIILLKIWCSRNKYIFENINHSIQEIGAQVFSLLNYVLKAFASPPIVFNRLCESLLGFDLTLAYWLLTQMSACSLNLICKGFSTTLVDPAFCMLRSWTCIMV